jgi:hypothetical protein
MRELDIAEAEAVTIMVGRAASELPRYLRDHLALQLDRNLLSHGDVVLLREQLSPRRRRLLDRMIAEAS